MIQKPWYVKKNQLILYIKIIGAPTEKPPRSVAGQEDFLLIPKMTPSRAEESQVQPGAALVTCPLTTAGEGEPRGIA
jgi:hypothetical protein